ncbi:hypothetical protein PFISCL1PPCAC_24673, partial [Pristionchus fissidentatus]
AVSTYRISSIDRRMTRLVPVIPDGGWGWVVVVGSFLIHVLADGFVYSFGVLVEELVKEYNASNGYVAVILSLLTGLTLGFGPVASAVTDKYGCRTSTIVGSVIATIGCALTFWATSIFYICITVGVIMGVGIGLMYCPAIVIVTMYFEKRRALATGLAVSGAGIGTFVFPVVYGYIRSNMGWRYVFVLGAGCMAFCGLCGSTFRPLQFIECDDEEEDGAIKSESSAKDGNEVTKESAALLAPPIGFKSSVNSLHKSHGDLGAGDAENGGHRSRAGTITEGTGYLSVKGVRYTGSITDVAEFKENPDKYRSMTSLHSAHHKASKLGDLKEVDGDDDVFEAEKSDESRISGILSSAARMLNLNLLIEPAFVLFAISNLLTSVGFNSPLYFLPTHATKGLGLLSDQGDNVLSVFGVCNTIGRITFGLVGDCRLPFLPRGWGNDTARNRLWIYNLSLTICGILTCMSYVFDSYYLLCVYAGAFGFTISSYICLTSVILVDLLGLERLTNAFGLLLLFQGVGTVFGPPLSGWLADINGNNYNYSFFFCGVNLLASGLMMFATPFLRKSTPPPSSNGAKKPVMMH